MIPSLDETEKAGLVRQESSGNEGKSFCNGTDRKSL